MELQCSELEISPFIFLSFWRFTHWHTKILKKHYRKPENTTEKNVLRELSHTSKRMLVGLPRITSSNVFPTTVRMLSFFCNMKWQMFSHIGKQKLKIFLQRKYTKGKACTKANKLIGLHVFSHSEKYEINIHV